MCCLCIVGCVAFGCERAALLPPPQLPLFQFMTHFSVQNSASPPCFQNKDGRERSACAPLLSATPDTLSVPVFILIFDNDKCDGSDDHNRDGHYHPPAEGDCVHMRADSDHLDDNGVGLHRLADVRRLETRPLHPLHRRGRPPASALRHARTARMLPIQGCSIHPRRRRSVRHHVGDGRRGDFPYRNGSKNERPSLQIQVLPFRCDNHGCLPGFDPGGADSVPSVLRRRAEPGQPDDMGVRLGVRSGLGRRHFPVWRRGPLNV